MSNSVANSYQNSTATARNYSLGSPDLTQFPPRSPRTRLGGYVHLPRLIDKARAVLAGKAGDFHYNCPLDQQFFLFTGLDPEALLAEIKAGKSDSEILAYVQATSPFKRQAFEIAEWSRWFEQRTPSNVEARAFFNEIHTKNAAHREDIVTWFDWLELDDYVSYGGKA